MNHLNEEQLAAYLATNRHQNGRYKHESYLMDNHIINCRECAGRLMELIRGEQGQPRAGSGKFSSHPRAQPLMAAQPLPAVAGQGERAEPGRKRAWGRVAAGTVGAVGIVLILSVVDRWMGWMASVSLAFALGAICNETITGWRLRSRRLAEKPGRQD